MSYKQTKKGGKSSSKTYASSYWYDAYDTDYDYLYDYGGYTPSQKTSILKSNNLYKLASVRRAISNFVQIVTGKSIPVTFATKSESKTDGNKVILSADVDDNFDVSVGLALHEGSHIVLSDFNLLRTMGGLSDSYFSFIRTIAAHNAQAEAEGKELPYPNFMDALDRLMESAINNYGGKDTKKYIPLAKDVFLSTGRFKNTVPMNQTMLDTLAGLTNWIEDRRIDLNIYRSAPGYRDYYTSMYDYYFNDKAVTKGVASDEFTQETIDSYMFRIINLMNTETKLSKLKGLRNIYRILDLNNIGRIKSSLEAYQLALEIMDEILKHTGFNPESKQPQPQPGGNGQSGENGDGENEIEIDEITDGDGQGNMGGGSMDVNANGKVSASVSNDPAGSNGTGKSATLSKTALQQLRNKFEKQKQFLNGEVKKKSVTKEEQNKLNDIAESESELVRAGMDYEKTSRYGRPVSGKGVDVIVVKRLTDNLLNSDDFPFANRDYSSKEPRRWAEEYVNKGVTLGTLLGKKLQVRNESRETVFSRLKKGKIDKRLVASLGFDNEGVFYTNEVDQYKKANLHISLDYSGSMSGTKLQRTITATVAIVKACEMARNVNVQVSIRSTDSSRSGKSLPYICMVYDSRKDSFRRFCKYMSILDANNTTPEGLCFEAIQKYLIPSANDMDSYFLNFSDGQPCYSINSGSDQIDYSGDGAAEHTKRQVKKMQENGINVLSYFITTRDGSNFEYSSDWEVFKKCYGKAAKYVNVESVFEVAKTMNDLFLQKADKG